MPVDRPIFILAPPRQGTTVLHECIGSHPDVGYFNRANKKFMRYPRFAQFVTRLGLYGDHPRESHKIWEQFIKGEDDVRLAGDATPEMKKWYHSFIEAVLKARRATRFVNKIPSNTFRVPWLDALFPDALFVQIVRDWRAVVSSTVIKREKDHPQGGWFGVMPHGWRAWEKEPPEMGAAWSFVEAHKFLEEQEAAFGSRYMKVWYEDLCRDPVTVMKEVFKHCDLSWNQESEALLPEMRTPLRAWEKPGARVTPEMYDRIREKFGDGLVRYEYTPE